MEGGKTLELTEKILSRHPKLRDLKKKIQDKLPLSPKESDSTWLFMKMNPAEV